MATIITFANQKGGVGKTTLLALFANYITNRKTFGEKVLVVDTDTQGTLIARRKQDVQLFQKEQVPYEVGSLKLTDIHVVENLMSHLNNTDNDELTVIFDTPGDLSLDGLATVFVNSDWIVVPFQYEENTWMSLMTFLRMLKMFKEKLPQMTTKVVLVPNNIRKGTGTVDELELWNKRKEILRQTGLVAPPIWTRENVRRYNTLFNYKEQDDFCKDTFEFIIKKIKDQNGK